VGIILSAESVRDWIEAGKSVSRRGQCVGVMTQCMLLKTNIIKSNSKNTIKLHIVSGYYPDLGEKTVEDFQNFSDKVASSVKNVQNENLIIIGA
jgi:hypothetical protein